MKTRRKALHAGCFVGCSLLGLLLGGCGSRYYFVSDRLMQQAEALPPSGQERAAVAAWPADLESQPAPPRRRRTLAGRRHEEPEETRAPPPQAPPPPSAGEPSALRYVRLRNIIGERQDAGAAAVPLGYSLYENRGAAVHPDPAVGRGLTIGGALFLLGGSALVIWAAADPCKDCHDIDSHALVAGILGGPALLLGLCLTIPGAVHWRYVATSREVLPDQPGLIYLR